MGTRFLNRGLGVTDDPKGNWTAFAFDRDDLLHSRILSSAAAAVEDRYVPISGLQNQTTATVTLSYADHGKTFAANSASTVIFTLPATRKGVTYTFVVAQLPGSGAGTSVSPNSADKIMGNGFTAADDKDAQNSAASDRIGDSITLVGDGLDGWYITSVTGTWAREA